MAVLLLCSTVATYYLPKCSPARNVVAAAVAAVVYDDDGDDNESDDVDFNDVVSGYARLLRMLTPSML